MGRRGRRQGSEEGWDTGNLRANADCEERRVSGLRGRKSWTLTRFTPWAQPALKGGSTSASLPIPPAPLEVKMERAAEWAPQRPLGAGNSTTGQ